MTAVVPDDYADTLDALKRRVHAARLRVQRKAIRQRPVGELPSISSGRNAAMFSMPSSCWCRISCSCARVSVGPIVEE